MVRAIIVEDEHLVRERIRILIKKSGQPFTIVGTCGNGTDALALIEKERPDTAFIDIMMPKMDGLELAAEVKRRGLETRIVVITGYDKFEFARSALQSGVSDYLLKPLKRPDFFELLRRIARDWENRRIAAEITRDRISYARHNLLRQLMESAGDPSAEERGEGWEDGYHIREDLLPFYIGLVNRSCVSADIRVEIEGRNIEVIAVSPHHMAVVVGQVSPSSRTNSEEIINALRDGQATAEQCPVGVSQVHNHIGGFSAAYSEALEDWRRAFMEDVAAVTNKGERAVEYIDALKETFLVLLRTRDTAAIFALLDSITLNRGGSPMAYQDFIYLVNEVRLAATQIAREADCPSLYDLYTCKTANDVVERLGLIDSVIAYLKNMLSLLISELAKRDGSTDTVIAIRRFVERNYRREITVGSISAEMDLNASYVSSVFRKNAGLSLTRYLNSCRLSSARKELLAGVTSVAEAAFQNGFSDQYYFSKLFKKKFGISPGACISRPGGS